MATISLCMIVKNEEKVIGRCLESVKDVMDEIIIVDTGSTDKTTEIVKKYTDKIYNFEWIDHFAAARNYSFLKASMDYIFWMDADDILPEDNQKKFLAMKETLDPAIDAVSMNYNLAVDGEGNVTSSLRRHRLVKRTNRFTWVGAVHEYLAVGGNIIQSDIALTHQPVEHDSKRNLRIYENMLHTGTEFTPRDLLYYANELVDHGQYEKAINYYLKFLGTKQGWSEDCIRACGKLADCYASLKNKDKEIDWVVKSLLYDSPRPETCCRMGYYFVEQNKHAAAVYWYEQALKCGDESLPFQNQTCATWLPHLQLCVCYDKLGQSEKAFQHNELAAKYNPSHPSVQYNRNYFMGKLERDLASVPE